MTASSASAHAQLLGSEPASGTTVNVQPSEVIFKFNEAVDGTLGAVRIYDAQGNEVDDLQVSHPGGQQHWMGVGLKPQLPDGTYTATYRVTSADTHIVYGGMVFNIGRPGATPRVTVAGLIGRGQSGRVTKLAFGLVHGLDYLSIALFIGGLVFWLLAWLPALAGVSVADQQPSRRASAQAFAARLRRLLSVAVLLGVTASVLGVLLQGASAAGISLWSSLQGTVLSDTLASRFGEVWGVRALVWILLGLLLLAHHRFSPRLLRVLAGSGAAYLALTPALAGHASIESPVWIFFGADVVHVLAASIWVGGVACLLLVLPAATRQLEPGERSRLLLATLTRFSRPALVAVSAIAVTGVVQAYIDVRSLDGLLHTTYGALVIVKVGLLLLLIALGWINRGRVIPALGRIVGAGNEPGTVGVLARRTLRGEIALMLAVFGVTAALVSYTPPIDAASGPFSANTTLGPLELELTVDPARVGPNTIHLYLINAADGSQFAQTKELTVTAALPTKQIGPLPLKANLSGPGHYTLNSAQLSPAGTWTIQITDRVSEFQEYTKTLRVPIR
jgi:copper transport protein